MNDTVQIQYTLNSLFSAVILSLSLFCSEDWAPAQNPLSQGASRDLSTPEGRDSVASSPSGGASDDQSDKGLSAGSWEEKIVKHFNEKNAFFATQKSIW